MGIMIDIDQRNRAESPKINPYIYGHLVFNKAPRLFNGKRIIVSTNGAEVNGSLHAKG